MRVKIESRKGNFYVEEKAMQRGVSVVATWSVGKDGERGRGLPYGEEENHVKDFRALGLWFSGEAYAEPPDLALGGEAGGRELGNVALATQHTGRREKVILLWQRNIRDGGRR